ncbi:uncharacterized protein ACIB01_019319 [Guaruba guarouba]
MGSTRASPIPHSPHELSRELRLSLPFPLPSHEISPPRRSPIGQRRRSHAPFLSAKPRPLSPSRPPSPLPPLSRDSALSRDLGGAAARGLCKHSASPPHPVASDWDQHGLVVIPGRARGQTPPPPKMKVDRTKLKKTPTEAPADCRALIEKLKACGDEQLVAELQQIKTWNIGKVRGGRVCEIMGGHPKI